MRYAVVGENPIESVLMGRALVPTSQTEGYAPMYARVLLLAAERGMFDALRAGPRTAEEVAASCGTKPAATEKLLNLLATMRYVRRRDDRFTLGRQARRWLLADAPGSIRDQLLMKRLEWRWIEGLDQFLESGEPLDVHGAMTDEDWGMYQRGMRAQANLLAPIIARAVPMPNGAREMLDIGGSHGYFSVLLCRRYPALRATVLDLPGAVVHAQPLLDREGMGERVTLRAGDALRDDLGTGTYDLIMLFSLVHHFTADTNRALMRASARALRPGGVVAIGEVLRPQRPGHGQLGAFFDLYFALTSESGLWTPEEIAGWQADAGLRPRKLIHPPFVRELGLQVADKLS
jgi:predicted O-methyltransferase YrrM